MRRRPFQIVAPLFLVAAVISAAGCGGGGSKNTTSTTTTTTATATTTPSTGATGALGALASAANCKDLANLEASFASALTGAGGNVQKEATVLQQFAAKTPPDIRPSFVTIANALAQAKGALQAITSGSVSPSNLAKLKALDTPQVKTAITKVEAWAKANCHA